MLDEPPTGLIALKSSGIRQFQDIVGKRVGYIGEFGKIIVQDLAKLAGIDLNAFETVRVGMNISDAILRGVVDTGIGFINYQQIESEMLSQEETVLLRLDQLAGLGCCCFCSIQFIAHQDVLDNQPEMLSQFMEATQRGAAFTVEHPEEAFELLCQTLPQLRNPMHQKIFTHTLPFFSRNLKNVPADWHKVGQYTQHLRHSSPRVRCAANVYRPLFTQHTVFGCHPHRLLFSANNRDQYSLTPNGGLICKNCHYRRGDHRA